MKRIINFVIIVIICINTNIFSQNQKWMNYTNGDWISVIKIDNDNVWIGTSNGLVKTNLDGTDQIFYDKLNSGLPSNYINCIEFDIMGNIWIGTENGLTKYDGNSWEVFNITNSKIPSNSISFLLSSNDESLWFSTKAYYDETSKKYVGNGIGTYKNGIWEIFDSLNSTLSNNHINCISFDDSSYIWIGTSEGLIKFKDRKWELFNISNSGLQSNAIISLVIDNSGNKWIGTYDGLIKYDDNIWIKYNNYIVRDITIDKLGNKWVATEESTWDNKKGGLFVFDNLTWTVYNSSNSGLPNNKVYCIEIDKNGNKWIGTFLGGLTVFDDLNWNKINTSNSEIPYFINCIAIDNFNNKWFGTKESLLKFDGSNWTHYKTDLLGLSETQVSHLVVDKSNNKWMTIGFWYASSGALVKFNNNNWTIYDATNSVLFQNETITCLTEDRRGVKWFGTNNGLIKYDDVEWTRYTETSSGLGNNFIISISVDELNNKWILHPDYPGKKILTKFDDKKWEIYSDTLSHSDSYWCLTIDNDNKKWIGLNGDGWGPTELGLLSFDDNKWITYNKKNSFLPSELVTSITVDEFNNKWIGTFQGLAKFDNNNWTIFNEINSGLPNNVISCIKIDNFGNKWIGFQGGIAEFNENGIVTELREETSIKSDAPSDFKLYQNYPNPFNPSTTIEYSVPKLTSDFLVSNVTLKIYDILGKEVSTLVNKIHKPGFYKTTWEASNIPSGVYFYKLTAGMYVESKKMILVK